MYTHKPIREWLELKMPINLDDFKWAIRNGLSCRSFYPIIDANNIEIMGAALKYRSDNDLYAIYRYEIADCGRIDISTWMITNGYPLPPYRLLIDEVINSGRLETLPDIDYDISLVEKIYSIKIDKK